MGFRRKLFESRRLPLDPLFKRIILRAVLNDVSPIVARVIAAVPDDLEISDRRISKNPNGGCGRSKRRSYNSA